MSSSENQHTLSCTTEWQWQTLSTKAWLVSQCNRNEMHCRTDFVPTMAHATALEQKGDGYVLASLGEESGYVPYTAFSARRSYIQENPEVIESFTRGLQKGMEYVNSHSPEELAKVIKQQFEEMDETS